MPEISRFFGIAPPHFHAFYGEFQASTGIETLEVIEGWLPLRAMALVVEWAVLHRAELRENWNRARLGQPLRPIPPLR
jgi:hypothetical protein